MSKDRSVDPGQPQAGVVASLEDLVAYQDDAVVSRTVLNKETGTITVFAFDGNQGLSEHTVAHDALVHVLDGEVEISIAGQPNRLRAGEFIVMPANRPHAVRAVTPFKMMLVMIRA